MDIQLKTGSLQVTILLLVVLSTLNYQLASGQDYGCRVNISPGDPTELDEVEVQVSFHFRTDPPHVSDFSSVVQKDNVFLVNATVLVPKKDEFVLQVVHTDSFTYELGKLNAGNYTFEVCVKTIHGSEEFSCVKKSGFRNCKL